MKKLIPPRITNIASYNPKKSSHDPSYTSPRLFNAPYVSRAKTASQNSHHARHLSLISPRFRGCAKRAIIRRNRIKTRRPPVQYYKETWLARAFSNSITRRCAPARWYDYELTPVASKIHIRRHVTGESTNFCVLESFVVCLCAMRFLL